MKILNLLILFLFLRGGTTFILAQDTLKPFIVSSLIGEKLDRNEEDFFGIFPTITDFQEATFYMNPDSSLNVNIKGYYHNAFVDTTFRYLLTLRQLREKLNLTVLAYVKADKVRDLEFSTVNDEKYTGTVYSFNNDRIKLLKDKFAYFDYQTYPDEYFPELSYSDLNKITYYESNAAITVFVGLLGLAAGAGAGAAMAPSLIKREPGMIDMRSATGGFFGGILGGILGFAFGSMIKVPVEYGTEDSRQIVIENTLLH